MNIEENQSNTENKSFKLIKTNLKYKNLFKTKKNLNENSIVIFTKNIIEYIILGIPFILMDYFIRKEAKKIYLKVSQKYSYIFSYTYIIFFIFSSKSFKGNIGKIYYSWYENNIMDKSYNNNI